MRSALALLTAIYAINNIDRNLIPAMAEPIKQAFGLSDSQLGALVGVVYALAFVLTGLPMGLLIDRVNRTRLIAGLLAAWSAIIAATGAVPSFTMLVLTRLGVGIAAAGASITLTRGSVTLISFPGRCELRRCPCTT